MNLPPDVKYNIEEYTRGQSIMVIANVTLHINITSTPGVFQYTFMAPHPNPDSPLNDSYIALKDAWEVIEVQLREEAEYRTRFYPPNATHRFNFTLKRVFERPHGKLTIDINAALYPQLYEGWMPQSAHERRIQARYEKIYAKEIAGLFPGSRVGEIIKKSVRSPNILVENIQNAYKGIYVQRIDDFVLTDMAFTIIARDLGLGRFGLHALGGHENDAPIARLDDTFSNWAFRNNGHSVDITFAYNETPRVDGDFDGRAGWGNYAWIGKQKSKKKRSKKRSKKKTGKKK